MSRHTAAERVAFVREQTALAPVPLVPEVQLYTARAVATVWFHTARWLDDDDAAVPFWSVPWAGGQALARWVLDRADTFRGARVLDFACGSGIVGIAAARAGALVRAVDIDPLAAVATRLNQEANAVAFDIATSDVVGDALADVDIVLAGDVWYEPGPSARFRRWFRRLAARGKRVVTADSGRPYAPRDARELARYVVPTPFELEATATRTARILAF